MESRDRSEALAGASPWKTRHGQESIGHAHETQADGDDAKGSEEAMTPLHVLVISQRVNPKATKKR